MQASHIVAGQPQQQPFNRRVLPAPTHPSDCKAVVLAPTAVSFTVLGSPQGGIGSLSQWFVVLSRGLMVLT